MTVAQEAHSWISTLEVAKSEQVYLSGKENSRNATHE